MLNKHLQEKNVTVCEFIAKVKAFLAKLRLWRGNICSGTFSMFSTVTEFLRQNPQIETTRFSELVTEHLMKLEKKIDGYFSSLGEDEVAYLRNPFTTNVQTLQAGTGMQEELFNMMDLHTMCIQRKIWEIFGLRCASRTKGLRNLPFKHCCCFHQHVCVNRHFQ